jgi:hypothetical protein
VADVLVALAGFAAFLGIYAYFRRHPEWSRGEDGRPYSAPGWWRPLAIGWLAVLCLFVVYASLANSFEWGMLLVFPVLGGAFALGVVFLRVLGRRVG